VIVALTTLQVLDKAVEAGGSNLAGKAIAGAGKGASAILNELCASGFLRTTPGQSVKYSITPEGRAVWEKEAPPERRKQVQEREGQQARKKLVEFLTLVRQKGDKALSKTDVDRFSAAFRQDACDRGLVEPGPRTNTYRLLPAGGEMLREEQPLDQQFKDLRQLHQQTVAHWRATQQSLKRELEGVGGQASHALQAASAHLSEQAQQSHRAFEQALTELGAFPVLLNAARQVRADVDAACREALQRLESEKTRIAALEVRMGQASGQQREQLESFGEQVGSRLDDFARRLTAQTEENRTRPATGGLDTGTLERLPPKAPSGHASLPLDAEGFVRRWQQEQRTDCPLPELYRYLRQRAPGLSIGAFHDLLRSLYERDRVRFTMWNGSLDRMPSPELALLISSEVMYYANV
jgi:hypothetical protein